MLVNEVPIKDQFIVTNDNFSPDEDDAKLSNQFGSFSNLQSFNENYFAGTVAKNDSENCALQIPDHSIPFCGLSLTFTSNITYKYFQLMKKQFSLIFKVNYPEEFFKKVYEKNYFTIFGIEKISKELTCFAILDINQEEKCADILALGVVKEFQSKKLGSTLLKKIVEELTSMGICEVKLIVQKVNIIAIKLYEKFGFTKFNFLENYYNFESEVENKAYVMKKILVSKKFWIFEVFKRITDKIFLKSNNVQRT
jgi:ribosomal protein S18 acetylase RimI-like enzyme